MRRKRSCAALACTILFILTHCTSAGQRTGDRYWISVSNEGSGDVTIIDAATHEPIATIPVGKRLRGIHSSPDGRYLYVALSGPPNTGPPQLDAQGKPIFKEIDEDEIDHDASCRDSQRRTRSSELLSQPANIASRR